MGSRVHVPFLCCTIFNFLSYYHYIVLLGSLLIVPVLIDDPGFSPESGDGELEGMLVRKHEWESTTKKASNR